MTGSEQAPHIDGVKLGNRNNTWSDTIGLSSCHFVCTLSSWALVTLSVRPPIRSSPPYTLSPGTSFSRASFPRAWSLEGQSRVSLADIYRWHSDFILFEKSLTSGGAWSGQLSETSPPSSQSLEAVKRREDAVNYEKILQKYRISSENWPPVKGVKFQAPKCIFSRNKVEISPDAEQQDPQLQPVCSALQSPGTCSCPPGWRSPSPSWCLRAFAQHRLPLTELQIFNNEKNNYRDTWFFIQ